MSHDTQSLSGPQASPRQDASPRRKGILISAAIVVIILAFVGARTLSDRRAVHPHPVATPPPTASRSSELSAVTAELRTRLTQDPADLKTRLRLAAALQTQGDPSQAEDVLDAALQRGQKTAEVYRALGSLYMHTGVFNGAIQAFQAEILMSPKSAQAHVDLAQALSYIYHTKEALEHVKKAQELDPKYPDTYLWFAYLNDSPERFPVAVSYLNKYIGLAKQKGPGYGLLCRVYLNMLQYDKAIAAGKQATAALPNDANCWYNLGEAYADSQKPDSLHDAEQAFRQAVAITPAWGHAHFQLGYCYARENEPDQAIAEYRIAVKCDPAYGKYHYQLGRLLVQQHQEAEGRREIAAAQPLIALNQRENSLQDKLVVDSKDYKLYFELGQVYLKLSNGPEAVRCFKAVLDLNPAYPGAREALEQAERLPPPPGGAPPPLGQ